MLEYKGILWNTAETLHYKTVGAGVSYKSPALIEKTKSIPLEMMTTSGPSLSVTPSFQQFLRLSTSHPINGVCVCVCVRACVRACVCVCV